MNNKIRKLDSTVSPTPSRSTYGPATAGVEYDMGIDALIIDPDGTKRPMSAKFTVQRTIADGTSAANYAGPIYIAPFPVDVIAVTERHATLGTNGSAVTLDVIKVASGTIVGSGVAVLGTTKIDLKATVDTNQSPALTSTAADKRLAAGDALILSPSGTLTAVAGICVSVVLRRRAV